MKLYKLTTQDGKTRPGYANECQWGPGVSHSGTGEGPLCGPGWIHAYTHPLIAVLMNPIHAGFADPILWEAEGDIALTDGPVKVGCRTLTTIQQIPLPSITAEQKVRFAILCTKAVYRDPAWNAWADRWLTEGPSTLSDVLFGMQSIKPPSMAEEAARHTARAAGSLLRPGERHEAAGWAAGWAAAGWAAASAAASATGVGTLDLASIAEEACRV